MHTLKKREVYILDRSARWKEPAHVPGQHLLRNVKAVRTQLGKAAKYSSILVYDAPLVAPLLESKPTQSKLLWVVWRAPDLQSVPAMRNSFPHVLGDNAEFRFLPDEELSEVLRSDLHEARDLLIGGIVDPGTRTLLLVRGDLTRLVVPLSAFTSTPAGTTPDFGELAFTDYGQTVRFGEYEASADGILYEFDADYRKRLEKTRLQEEKTFGASLRRLRLQRRLAQTDFAPLSEKTIGRIERNETPKPHGKTLSILARRLGVGAEEIAEY
jgi:hypothetical protein